MSDTTKRAPITERVSHYSGACEPIDLIISCGYGKGFAAGNVIKYVARYARKNGVDDLMKARDYLEALIAMEGGENRDTDAKGGDA